MGIKIKVQKCVIDKNNTHNIFLSYFYDVESIKKKTQNIMRKNQFIEKMHSRKTFLEVKKQKKVKVDSTKARKE